MSNNTNLRPEAGGDPARSNSTDLKNRPKAPRDDNDFPDAPDRQPDDSPQDKPDLDAFAKRMGTDTIADGEGLDAIPDRTPSTPDATTSRLTLAGGAAVVAGLLWLVVRRRKRSRSAAAKAAALDVVHRIHR